MACFVLSLATLCLAMALLYWAYPGGPAWGKYSLTHASSWVRKPIPGPKGWPVIGSIGLMTGLAHRKIAAAAERCGGKRVMAFSVGETRAIVTCHPGVAKEILHSPDFADRPVKESAYSLMFNRAMGFAPYGVYWRTLRRVASIHMFSPKQIRTYEAQRRELATEMVSIFRSKTGRFRVREVLKRASLSNMMGSVFGRRCALIEEEEDSKSVELKEMVDEGYDLLGILNWADHLSWLSHFDLQNIRVRCSKLVPKVKRFVARIIDQHRGNPVQSQLDFAHVLLSLQGSDKLSDSDVIAVLWVSNFF